MEEKNGEIIGKLLKALGSSAFIGLIISVIANVVGLQVEYTVYQPQNSTSEKLEVTHQEEKTKPTVINEPITPSVKHADGREISFVPYNFAISKQKWYTKLLGLILVLFPFFYSPFSEYFKNKRLEIQIMTRHAYDNPIGREWAKGLYWGQLREMFILFIISLVVFFFIIFALAKYFKFDFAMYALLIYERFFNYVVGLI